METKVVQKESLMGTAPIRSLLLKMAAPIAISMLVGALYNIVDSMYVAQYSQKALTALSMAFPYQNLMIAVGVGTGVGINSLLSKSLGEKNQDMANRAASNGVFLGLLSFFVFALLAIFFAEPFMRTQTDIQEIIEYGVTYIRICGIFSFGQIGQLIFEKLLQSTGRTGYMIMTQGVGAVLNIILDYFFIFGWGSFQGWGVAGAAIATVISQITAACLAVYINTKKNDEITLSFKNFRPDLRVIKVIYSVGLPSIIVGSISSIMVFFMNKILVTFTETAATALGIYFKVQSFVYMPVFGFTNALVPIVAYNYGAQKKSRIKEAVKDCFVYVTILMVVGVTLVQLFPQGIINFFSPTPELIEIGVPALRIISTSFVFAGFCIVGSSYFQALGNGVFSMIMSISRQLIVLVPVAFLLSKSGNVHVVWWAFLIAELFAVALCSYCWTRVNRNKVDLLPDTPPEIIPQDFVEPVTF